MWSMTSKLALVIDPLLDFDPAGGKTSLESLTKVTELIRSRGLKLGLVLETHAHANLLSGARYLKSGFGAKVAIEERIKEAQATFNRSFRCQRIVQSTALSPPFSLEPSCGQKDSCAKYWTEVESFRQRSGSEE